MCKKLNLGDRIYERIDWQECTADDDADKAGHDDHEDWFDHSRNRINLSVELVFVDLGGFAKHFVNFTGFLANGGHLRYERKHIFPVLQRFR